MDEGEEERSAEDGGGGMEGSALVGVARAKVPRETKPQMYENAASSTPSVLRRKQKDLHQKHPHHLS